MEVRTGSANNEVLIGSHLLGSAGELIKERLRSSLCAIVSDTNVASCCADLLKQSLASSGFRSALITIPAGEKSKSLEQAGAICDRMARAGLDRSSFIIALGGGVVGDLAGFVAAIYHRGIPWVNIPTTLLAMVDSSIGGKTAVNTPAGKNLIGALHHPVLVISDVDTLDTLPPREWKQGFAEIIKHAIIRDARMFEEVAQGSVAAAGRPGKDASRKVALQSLIRRNVEIKAAIVAADEWDATGERALLNFGHTVGHAIERAGAYRNFLHGEALSLGIVAACDISKRRAGLSETERDKIVRTLQAFDLPTRLASDFPREKILEAIQFDKKFERGEVRFVVTPAIGSARLTTDVTMGDIREAVAML